MLVVAIDSLGEDRESLARALAGAMGVTIYDALVRLRSPGTGPLVIAVFRDDNAAKEKIEKLGSAGFRVHTVGDRDIEADEKRTIVQRFLLGDSFLEVKTGSGEPFRVDYLLIDRMIRGMRIGRSIATDTTKERRFAPGRALLTGGLSVTKTTTTTQETTTEEREGFIQLYSGDQRPLVFQESELVFDSLGPAMKQTRTANFTYLVSELRRRCPAAVYDERLVNKAAQHQLLGPMFDPVKHLDLALTLLARSLRTS